MQGSVMPSSGAVNCGELLPQSPPPEPEPPRQDSPPRAPHEDEVLGGIFLPDVGSPDDGPDNNPDKSPHSADDLADLSESVEAEAAEAGETTPDGLISTEKRM